MNNKNQSMEFETDGHGVYGYGTGRFILSKSDSISVEYPAAWSNTDPQKIGITGEVVMLGEDKPQYGTLLFRTKLMPGQEIKGDAIFIDEMQHFQKGLFTMKRLLGPEQIMQKKK